MFVCTLIFNSLSALFAMHYTIHWPMIQIFSAMQTFSKSTNPKLDSRLASSVVSPQSLVLGPRSSLLTPHSSLLNSQSSIFQSSLLNPQSSVLNPQFSIIGPRSSILNNDIHVLMYICVAFCCQAVISKYKCGSHAFLLQEG